MLELKSFTFNGFSENTYLIFDTETSEGVLIDPGMCNALERKTLAEFIELHGITIQAIWLTHSHIDHILGLAWSVERFNCPYFQTKIDHETLTAAPLYAGLYGLPKVEVPEKSYTPIQHGDKVSCGQHSFEVRFCPGHAPGHVVFYHPTLGVLGGDVLFAGSIGRTDLPGADFATLEISIKKQLYILPDSTRVYPGHGPYTTIGQEKLNNPYVRATSFDN